MSEVQQETSKLRKMVRLKKDHVLRDMVEDMRRKLSPCVYMPYHVAEALVAEDRQRGKAVGDAVFYVTAWRIVSDEIERRVNKREQMRKLDLLLYPKLPDNL